MVSYRFYPGRVHPEENSSHGRIARQSLLDAASSGRPRRNERGTDWISRGVWAGVRMYASIEARSIPASCVKSVMVRLLP